ncbi:MAG: PQQ-binding-like beta-propeller repeat protein [Bacteroidia bacterium]|nr:PQQ-binding-like beta-propeller repeat protein [Bacteroidia bacterium]
MKLSSIFLLFFLFFLFFLSSASKAQYYDWPMWRYDYGRSASTPEQLADKLYLQWQVKYSERSPVWDDPLNQNLMQFDRIFEPIVADNKIFFGFNDQDKVIALDINSGKELWHYYADGPVRLPLAANNDKIYFISDDGNCYCLNADNGSLVWKLSLAPASNKLLGNKRLISMWPARGGIVIKNNIIYSAASIFPMMGTFIYAINADTGEIIWKNEGTGSNYILQPHKSPAFADIAPQGNFTISGDRLLVAGGRSVPAAFDIKTGKELYYKLAENQKTGGAFTCSNDKFFFNHYRERMTNMYNSATGDKLKSDVGEYPVIDGNTIYFSGKEISASTIYSNNKIEKLWKSDFPATNDLIKAGDCLYAADSTGITAIKIVNGKPQKLWTRVTEKRIERLVASNGKLIAVSGDGDILVFGDTPVSNISYIKQPEPDFKCESASANEIIISTGITNGYGVVFGANDMELLKSLVSNTSLTLIAYDNSPSRISYLREYFDGLGVKADRLGFLLFDKDFPLLPKYFSSLTIINDLSYLNGYTSDILNSIYQITRPYDGKIWVKTDDNDQKLLMNTLAGLNLYGAEISNGNGFSMISRTGSLKGSADWTHNYGNIANTVKSDDEIVKAPLGILWFGGNSNLDVLPRHGHGPPEQVIDGRLIIQGINSISARDVYTGRLIWKKEFENLKKDTWTVYYDETYDEENPLDTKYNQVHIPGANARGTNFIATKEYVYAIEGTNCHLINIKTGELVKTISTGEKNTQKLGYIGVYDSLLILGNNFTKYPEIIIEEANQEDKKEDIKEDKKDTKKFENFDLTASKELIIMDRFSGKKLWSITANHGFIHNSVIAGDGFLFCLDKLPQYLETKLKRRGENQPEGSRLLYLDIKTGEKILEETKNVFGTWLGYSSEHKLLLQATRPSRDMLTGEDGKRMIVYKTATKEILWDKAVTYENPPIISNDKIYTNGEGFSLLTGEPLYEKDLLTGEEVKWNYKREYGCGYVVASEHLLTFRSASAGFINLDVFEGTGSLGGFKAGCSANLIVANGVLNSPDYTRTCQCAYQNQTSLAFINMPWMNYWANSNYKWSGKQIKQLGLNLNAPGDRTSSDNVLWLEFPNAGGVSPGIPVKIDTVDYFQIRKDPISVHSENTSWISASAIGGIRSLEITLSKDKDVQETSYKIKLFFSELENKQAGERVFDVTIQNRKVLENFDIVSEAGKKDKEIIKSFTGIIAGNTLTIKMNPKIGNTILSGIELIQESAPEKKISAR